MTQHRLSTSQRSSQIEVNDNRETTEVLFLTVNKQLNTAQLWELHTHDSITSQRPHETAAGLQCWLSMWCSKTVTDRQTDRQTDRASLARDHMRRRQCFSVGCQVTAGLRQLTTKRVNIEMWCVWTKQNKWHRPLTTDTQTHRHTDRHTDTDNYTDRQSDRQTDILTDRQTDRHRETDTQTDIDRQTQRHRRTDILTDT